MIGGYIQAKRFKDALDMFHEMQATKIKPMVAHTANVAPYVYSPLQKILLADRALPSSCEYVILLGTMLFQPQPPLCGGPRVHRGGGGGRISIGGAGEHDNVLGIGFGTTTTTRACALVTMEDKIASAKKVVKKKAIAPPILIFTKLSNDFI
ncbi:hypothetical protein OSB04_010468 [Centaurea solstitialis]|uniref:Pentatricopeptide repeat-containing protein n=1 Tax=Centaurea solstitialis TaxID=347529 RepID=A0AA38T7M8_9ASTR|nr:hypothetical protein OSB04_010468 [Centaurea solstitialis]